MKLVYDESSTMSYGFYVCTHCQSKFYGPTAMHNSECERQGFDGCEYHFGRKHVETVKKRAEKYGPQFKWYGITLEILRTHFPEVL